MANHPVQLSVEHKGKTYGGIYSVSGNLMIARIPGVSSVSHEVGDAEAEPLAMRLLSEMLDEAERSGDLD